MPDIDGLSRVNETHDRAAGDEVLRSVARVLEGLVRGGDVVARLGGDEFGLLLRETDLRAPGARQRLRETIEQLRTQAGRARRSRSPPPWVSPSMFPSRAKAARRGICWPARSERSNA